MTTEQDPQEPNAPDTNEVKATAPGKEGEPTAEQIQTFYEKREKVQRDIRAIRREIEGRNSKTDGIERALDIGLVIFGGAAAFMIGSYALVPPESRLYRLEGQSVWEPLSVAVSLTVFVAATVARLLRLVSAPQLALSDVEASNSGRELLAVAANNCERIAGQHLARSRFYLTAGAVTAVAGVTVYLFALLSMGPRVVGDDEARMLRRAIAEVAIDIKMKKATLEEASGPVDTTKLDDALAKAERLESKLEIVLEKNRTASTLPLSREILTIARGALAFLFVEVIAGFLFTLAQRNDIQASYWRAHRQVYERLLATHDMMKEMRKGSGKEDLGQELATLLLTPIPPIVFTGKGDTNPSLQMVSALADMIQRAKDATKDAKDAAKDATKESGKGETKEPAKDAGKETAKEKV